MADENTDKKPDETTSKPDGKNSDGSESGKETQPPKTEDAKTITQAEHQAELDRVAAKTRKEEREKIKAEKEKEEKDRAEKEAKEKGDHEKLAQQYERERDTANTERNQALEQVKTVQAQYDALAARVSASVAEEIKLLPEHIAALAPSESDLNSRLEWLPKAKQAAAKEADAKPGNGRGPKPKGAPGDGDGDKAARAGQSSLYSGL